MTTPAVAPVASEIDALVAAQGNVRLAAERLHITPEELLAKVRSAEPSESVKAALIWQTFELLSDIRSVIGASLDDFGPGDLQRIYVGTLELLKELVAPAKPGPTTAVQNNFNFGDPDTLETARAQLAERLANASRAVDVTASGSSAVADPDSSS